MKRGVDFCRDCFPGGAVPVSASRLRPVVDGTGGRCASHGRSAKKSSGVTQHERYVQRVYGLPPGGYQELYEHQGGKCALCQRSTGVRKRLAVDHDHDTGLAYGLLCGPCNKDVMGWSRRDIQYFQRCIQYLVNPPARQLRIVAYHIEKRDDAPNGR